MNEKPVFMQLMDVIEDAIITLKYAAGDLIMSSNTICKLYKVNPATAMRALSLLSADGILEKDRGIGMRVASDAVQIIKNRRKDNLVQVMLSEIVKEAEKLGITNNELVSMLESKLVKNMRKE